MPLTYSILSVNPKKGFDTNDMEDEISDNWDGNPVIGIWFNYELVLDDLET
jgi:hypothetical protein